MSAERFIELVKEHEGFELYHAYRDDVDHVMGGKGDTYWYTVMRRGKVVESYVGTLRDGEWSDTYTKGSGAKKKQKEVSPGTTIGMIAEAAYLAQGEKWVTRVKDPKVIDDAHPHYHYVYGFGDKALDVSAQYGVTIAFSNLNDEAAGFHLRYLYTGDDVELP